MLIDVALALVVPAGCIIAILAEEGVLCGLRQVSVTWDPELAAGSPAGGQYLLMWEPAEASLPVVSATWRQEHLELCKRLRFWQVQIYLHESVGSQVPVSMYLARDRAMSECLSHPVSIRNRMVIEKRQRARALKELGALAPTRNLRVHRAA